jgi:hypothetical protein
VSATSNANRSEHWRDANAGGGNGAAAAFARCAAAEAEQIDPVARLVVVDDEFVAVGDVALDAGARHRSEQLLHEADRSGEDSNSTST